MRGASRGVLNAEQDAALARVVRNHVVREAGVTVRANYVALPFAAGQGVDEGGESRRIRGRVAPPSSPGSTVLSPKIAGLERRKAMRFRSFIVSQAVPEAKRYQLRLSALHAPHV